MVGSAVKTADSEAREKMQLTHLMASWYGLLLSFLTSLFHHQWLEQTVVFTTLFTDTYLALHLSVTKSGRPSKTTAIYLGTTIGVDEKYTSRIYPSPTPEESKVKATNSVSCSIKMNSRRSWRIDALLKDSSYEIVLLVYE